jgi:FixJ family two-component response regulator
MGVSAFLEKPFEDETLLETIERLLHRRNPPTGSVPTGSAHP